jgi:hypothetical protein
MAGTKQGAAKMKATMIAKLGSYEAYKEDLRIKSVKGGKNGHTGGFAAGYDGRERARIYGAVGGRISRRGKNKATKEKENGTSI